MFSSIGPINHFIHQVLNDKEAAATLISPKFLFVADYYDWEKITMSLEHVVLATGGTPKSSIEELLGQSWELIPCYLGLFRHFHADSEEENPLMFMHAILTGSLDEVCRSQLVRSLALPGDYLLSLDTGLISRKNRGGIAMIRNCPNKQEFRIGKFVSRSKSKLSMAIIILTGSQWPSKNFESCIKAIKENKGARYYNITSESFMNSPTAKRMKHISETHKIVADAPDSDLFAFVTYFLETEGRIVANIAAKEEPVEIIDLTKEKRKHKNIPSNVRYMTWRKYAGDRIDEKCWCCDGAISIEGWHAGHVIPASKGGLASVDNLRPLCQSCNLSMGDKYMADFIRDHDMKSQGRKEFDVLTERMASLAI